MERNKLVLDLNKNKEFNAHLLKMVYPEFPAAIVNPARYL